MDLKKIKKILNSKAEEVFDKLGMTCESFGDNVYSTCPVHDGSDNPRAFSFSIDKGIWKCWTRDCQTEYRNDIFGLIRGALSSKHGEELEFKDALKWACTEFNLKNNRSVTHEVVAETEDEFSVLIKSFKSTPSIKHQDQPIEIKYNVEYPSEYFTDRGFKKSTMKHFGVGDCYENGIMKERAIIPIHNDDGSEIVGLIGRSIKGYRTPKFLLYPKGFNKRHYFYNYHRAVKHSYDTGCLFVLEGQGDVWKLHESGVKNAVSIFGKTISKEQAEKIRRMPVTHLIVLMDNDQAGREARVQIQRQFGRMYKITFPRLSSKDIGDMSVYKIKKEILQDLKGTY